jgi:hydroxylamine dehydrogenase
MSMLCRPSGAKARKRYAMKKMLFSLLLFPLWAPIALGGNVPVSEGTETCLECHRTLHPGIVADWQESRMSRATPIEALKKTGLERRISVEKVPEGIAGVVVGCAECHTMNPDTHRDSFDHQDYRVHTIVTPKDCATCHAVEVRQYGRNLMSHAYANLKDNPVYHGLVVTANGVQTFEDTKATLREPDPETNADSCYYCHGTRVEVKGSRTKETDFGEMKLPILMGWPNQGVGRINPDESKGSCAACHTRHLFSIEVARKPYTCSECHKGLDVPAYKVYTVSKHGNIFSSLGHKWNFERIPWRAGKDFQAPTCASCHVSLVVSEGDEVVVERTHRMNDRLSWRIFGLIYAHPHPKSPDTTVIKNRAGLPLPTELTGEPVAGYLIDMAEQDERGATMQRVCLSCHSDGWVQGQFARFENTIKTTNEMTLTATKILLSAWDKGAAKGLAQKDSIFNETIEKKWVEQWLFFANSTRYASAMAGADYGVFANGRWYMAKNIQEMLDWLEFKLKDKK